MEGEGLVWFPAGSKDLMIEEENSEACFRIVPRLIPQPKWLRESHEVKFDDVFYFLKVESVLLSKWTDGQVYSLVRSKDKVAGMAFVPYLNYGENEDMLTDRAVRSLVRIFIRAEGELSDDAENVPMEKFGGPIADEQSAGLVKGTQDESYDNLTSIETNLALAFVEKTVMCAYIVAHTSRLAFVAQISTLYKIYHRTTL